MAGLSQEQSTATQPSKTVWVGASAGTGKTYVLTARVLRMMLQGTPPGNILCLTFTKAAATEMKNRIFRELGQWAVMNDVDLMETLAARVNEPASHAVMERARSLFAEVLDIPGGLKIMTFHSFCQSLLGRFPLEASLAPGFEAVDEQQASQLKQEARDSMLKKFSGRPSLKTVAQRTQENDFDKTMESLMAKSDVLLSLIKTYTPTGLKATMRRYFGLSSDSTLEKIIATACQTSVFDYNGLKAVQSCFESGKLSETKLVAPMDAFLSASEEGRPAYLDRYIQAFLTKEFKPRKTIPTKDTAKNFPACAEAYQLEQQRLYSLHQDLLTLEMIDATCDLLSLGFEQIRAYEILKHSRGVVDFDDMIDSTVSLLSGQEAAAWILYKMDGSIDHILVDEAQDTNRTQWQIVEALSGEFFAGFGARLGASNTPGRDPGRDPVKAALEPTSEDTLSPRTLFAVGDVKQSIYSFQKADPKEFVAARNRIFEKAENAEMDFGAVPLNKSFRSGAAVLSLVDAVFKKGTPAYEGLTFDGEEIKHRFARSGMAGSVELWPLITDGTAPMAPQENEPWQPPIHQQEKKDAEKMTALAIANHIEQLVAGDHKLESQDRPIHPGDILVIVRKRSTFVEHLTRTLKAKNIAVTGRDRMQLAKELPVMDMLSLMRFVLQPGDDLSCAEVLTGPLIGLSQDQVFTLAHKRKTLSLWQRLVDKQDNNSAFKQAYDFLSICLNTADQGTPFSFLMTVLSDLEGRKKLMQRLGDEINDALDEFLEEALQFEHKESPSLQTFLHGFDLSEKTIKRDMEEAGKAVRIMTAHGSKGLQAPIVYLPDTTSLPDTSHDSSLLIDSEDNCQTSDQAPNRARDRIIDHQWIYWTKGIKNLDKIDQLKSTLKQSMMAEYRRLLYVAMTRAEDHLYITGWQKQRSISEECWYSLVQQGFKGLDNAYSMVTDSGEKLVYSVEQTQKVKRKAKPLSDQPSLPLPAYFTKSAPPEPHPVRPLTPSRPDGLEPASRSPLDARSEIYFRRGRLIHSLLQWLPDVAGDRRRDAALRYLSNPGYRLPENDQHMICEEVMAVLDHPEASILFSPTSRAEVPIAGLLRDGTAISAQVDRLVVTDNTVWIIDYKTNQPAPKTSDAIPALYRQQMTLYKEALKQIYPKKTVKCYLLWTDILTLMEVI